MVSVSPADVARTDALLERCKSLQARMPPVSGTVGYTQSWSIDAALDQHQNLLKMHEIQHSIGQERMSVRRTTLDLLRIRCQDKLRRVRALTEAKSSDEVALKNATEDAREAAAAFRSAARLLEIEERKLQDASMEADLEKSSKEMVDMREAIDQMAAGDGPKHQDQGAAPSEERKYRYCTDCRVGGHGQRFCRYLLQRPNWKIYPYQKWFEDAHGTVNQCPLGRRFVDFTDETYFSRIAMHIKGRIWLEDKKKLAEIVPEVMPPTYFVENQTWIGDPPEDEDESVPPTPWFVKGTDRNFGTSIFLCQRPQQCMSLCQANESYVVQKHIPDPLLYNNGEKLHVKFYNLLVGKADGTSWEMYTYKFGYLCISPNKWSGTDLSKETQVTIIRTQKIASWEYWPDVYPKCREAVGVVIRRMVEQGKLEGRDKIQFEIFSADFVVTKSLDVFLLEFNMGPVLKDPEDHPTNHDAGMINGALQIVEPMEGGDIEHWDLLCHCQGPPPETPQPEAKGNQRVDKPDIQP